MAIIEDEIAILFEMKRVCELYIDVSALTPPYSSENPVILNAIKMLASVKNRLSHFCQHTIVEDVIEVGEMTKTVYYCNKCETTFTNCKKMK
jgi:hypothetical protein